MLRIEGAAALRLWPVDVDLAGATFRLPPAPAGEWMVAVVSGGMWEWEIIPGWIDRHHAADIDALLLDGRLTFGECTAVAREALTAAAGMAWWSAVRLIRAATEQPEAMAELLRTGINPAVAPLGAVTVVLYRIYTRHATKAQHARIDAELATPPAAAGVTAEDRYDEDTAADMWERAAAARGVA